MSIRRMLHTLLQSFGYDMHKVTSYADAIKKYAEYADEMREHADQMREHADQMREYDRPLPLLDLAVECALQKKRDFFFVQVGAHDGKSWDPLHNLVCRYGLKGLLIEPLPDVFEKLKCNYASQPQLAFENAAIAATNGETTIYRVRAGAPVEDWIHGCATLNRERMMTLVNGFKVQEYLEEVQVPALTMRAVLQKHHVSAVDLLQIDTEGYDLEVIKMAFHAQCHPGIIHFENEHLSDAGRCEARRLLAQNHYRFTDGSHDTLAILAPSECPGASWADQLRGR